MSHHILRFIVLLLLMLMRPLGARAQLVGLSTNLAGYVEGGTLNVEASMGFTRHWSVEGGVAYNPYYDRAKQRSFSMGGRYWLWHVYSGWWMSGKARYQEFSEERETISEGDRWGGAFSGGYTRILGRHINLDLGFGVWGGYEKYVAYACKKCGRYVDAGKEFFIMPDDIVVALTYIF